MSGTEYAFVETSPEKLAAALTAMYEKLSGQAVYPASPERLFIQWVANFLVQERVLLNHTGNQNIPSRARGENLDALAQLYGGPGRPQAKAAVCTQRFHISEPQRSAVLVPAGTRVSGPGGAEFATVEDLYIPIGAACGDVLVRCRTPGTRGNGLLPGQLSTLIDLYDYCTATENVTQSEGGSDAATDEEFYRLLRQSMDAFSCAGARGGYEYFAKQVSTEIGDVMANSPEPGVVKLYVLMKDGSLAGEALKEQVLAACSADEVRPLTDLVLVEDPEEAEYNVSFTYYTQTGTGKPAAEIKAAVERAVEQYTAWQSAKLGRDINPSTLHGLLMQTGVKRVELTEPVFTVLRDDVKSVPQVARLGQVSITNGGYEDE